MKTLPVLFLITVWQALLALFRAASPQVWRLPDSSQSGKGLFCSPTLVGQLTLRFGISRSGRSQRETPLTLSFPAPISPSAVGTPYG